VAQVTAPRPARFYLGFIRGAGASRAWSKTMTYAKFYSLIAATLLLLPAAFATWDQAARMFA
jgi:hypothetical protein